MGVGGGVGVGELNGTDDDIETAIDTRLPEVSESVGKLSRFDVTLIVDRLKPQTSNRSSGRHKKSRPEVVTWLCRMEEVLTP